MPELPEVETFRRFAEQYALHQPIRHVEVLRDKILQDVTPAELKAALTGHCFTEALRHGKHLFLAVSSKKGSPTTWVVLHFGMTGYLGWQQGHQQFINAYGDPARPQDHVRIRFDFANDGHLDFHEQRMFGKVGLISDLEAYLTRHNMGPDAMAISKPDFKNAITRRKLKLKPALMDQSLVAGIGNIYADEMLYQCGIHPERPVSELSQKELDCLYRQMRDILQRTVDCQADRDCLPPHYLLHVRHKKARCPKKQHPLDIKEIGGRTTYFCPECQKD
jgi:formamidopyrimidine-DNA glycosylase